MGMYTGLRVHCTLQPEFVEVIALLHDMPASSERRRWLRVASAYPEHRFLARYAVDERCDFIPFGIVCCMPDSWGSHVPGETWWHLDRDTGEWAFACSLKNYEDTIQRFLDTVLARIVDRVDRCETLYEEDSWCCPPTTHLFEDGRFRAVAGTKYDS